MAVVFYQCLSCGNIVFMVEDSGMTPVCCGEQMMKLEPKSKDNGTEKHLPYVTWLDDCTLRVNIGSVDHPMEDGHHIVFVCLEMKDGVELRRVEGKRKAKVDFKCCREEAVAVYAWCNIHGLWKTSLDVGKLPQTMTTTGCKR